MKRKSDIRIGENNESGEATTCDCRIHSLTMAMQACHGSQNSQICSQSDVGSNQPIMVQIGPGYCHQGFEPLSAVFWMSDEGGGYNADGERSRSGEANDNLDKENECPTSNTQPSSTLTCSQRVLAKRRGRALALQDISNFAYNLDLKFQCVERQWPGVGTNSQSGAENLNYQGADSGVSMNGKSSSRRSQRNSFFASADMMENYSQRQYLADAGSSASQATQSASFSGCARGSRVDFQGPAVSDMPVPIELRYKDLEFCFDRNITSDSGGSGSDSDYTAENGRNGHNLACNHRSNIAEPRKIGPSCSFGYMEEGDAVYKCQYCGAFMWFNEKVGNCKSERSPKFSLCCLRGKVQLPLMTAPPEVLSHLFFDKKTRESKNFHSNIRSYNNMFSFTSMGGRVDHSKNSGGSPYTFVLGGMNYHKIGSLLPSEGSKPVYSQLYIHDTENEVSNRIFAVSKHLKDCSIDDKIVDQIKKVLDEVNPFVKQYRLASSVINNGPHLDVKLRLISGRHHDGRTYNLPSANEVAALIVGDIDMNFSRRDVIVHELSGSLQRIDELHASYLPLQYPILFPKGEDGYRDDIQHCEETISYTKKKKMLSMREYFAYRLMARENEISTVLHAGKLFQQFIVDGYTMIEAQRLLWVRTHQKELRADLYQGLTDALLSGERNAASTGKRIVLPSSFTGGARYMLGNYQDAMALCRYFGYPSIFVTFTCNPTWPEISRYCDGQALLSSNRPDILVRVFQMKLTALMATIKKKKIFGTVLADVYTIEFQKRGLPHAHILLFLSPHDQLTNPSDVDKIISAEIPDKQSNPELHEIVKKFMVHGPCGCFNSKAPCMKDHKCSKYFPKKFVENTVIDDEGYPTYRRRDDGRTIEVKGVPLDNRYIVPYNPTLLLKFQAHINVEKCNQSTAIKYLFKYISKGNDRVIASIYDGNQESNGVRVVDEVQQYYNFRYISACEAAWRIFAFDIHHRYPAVERLSFHLPNQQYVVYSNADDVAEVLDKPRVCESMFLAWMKTNSREDFAKTLTYSEFPQHYVYQRTKRE
ncbi:uncharacterized protein LOC114717208 [Neltuma alba]|uniref:uncharacterized protein LOC114717208 n=1 Tax=Neltuma alba TaxID=207710 RepID=UPI0010A4C3EE|nr:uncharacterized protein LOC114717208 [Prosopis alba]